MTFIVCIFLTFYFEMIINLCKFAKIVKKVLILLTQFFPVFTSTMYNIKTRKVTGIMCVYNSPSSYHSWKFMKPLRDSKYRTITSPQRSPLCYIFIITNFLLLATIPNHWQPLICSPFL